MNASDALQTEPAGNLAVWKSTVSQQEVHKNLVVLIAVRMKKKCRELCVCSINLYGVNFL